MRSVPKRKSRAAMRADGTLVDKLPAPRKRGRITDAELLEQCGAPVDSPLRLKGKSTYDDETWLSICTEYVMTGAPLNHIVNSHRISMGTVEEWCKVEPKLLEDMAACRARAIGGYWGALREKAVGGDTKALIQMLQWMAPKSFGNTVHITTPLDRIDMGKDSALEVTSYDQAMKILRAANVEDDDEE